MAIVNIRQELLTYGMVPTWINKMFNAELRAGRDLSAMDLLGNPIPTGQGLQQIEKSANIAVGLVPQICSGLNLQKNESKIVTNFDRTTQYGTAIVDKSVNDPIRGTLKFQVECNLVSAGWFSYYLGKIFSNRDLYNVGLSNIDLGGESIDKTNWDNFPIETQGEKAKQLVDSNHYGIALMDGGMTIQQPDTAIALSALPSQPTIEPDLIDVPLTGENLSGESVNDPSLVCDQTDDGEQSPNSRSFCNSGPDTKALDLRVDANVEMSVSSTTTNGFNDNEISEKEIISLIDVLPKSDELRAALKTVTIDSSSDGTSKPVSFKWTMNAFPRLPAGEKLIVFVKYDKYSWQADYQSEIEVTQGSNELKLSDKFDNTISTGLGKYSIGDIMENVNKYKPVKAYQQTIDSTREAKYIATGHLNFESAQGFRYVYKSEQLPDISSKRSRKNKSIPLQSQKDIEVDGEQITLGAYYGPQHTQSHNATLRGTDQSDLIYMRSKNQTVHTHAGDDIVYGSSYADRIYAYDRGDAIYAHKGDDLIVIKHGSHHIDAGKGDDEVHLLFGKSDPSGSKHCSIRLGAGKDTVKLRMKNYDDHSLTIHDMALDDQLIFNKLKRNRLSVDLGPHSVSLNVDDTHFATLHNYRDQFSAIYPDSQDGSAIHELALLNHDQLTRANQGDLGVDDIYEQLVLSSLTDRLTASYDALLDAGKKVFDKKVGSIIESINGQADADLLRTISNQKDEYDSMTDLVVDVWQSGGDQVTSLA